MDIEKYEKQKAKKVNDNQPDKINEHSELSISQEKLNQYNERLRIDQNLSFGLISGFITSIVCAIIWGVVTVITEYQIGYMAIGVGFLVGFAIQFTGKGIDNIFGISGAILSVFGCFLGNFLSIVGFAANTEGLGYIETLFLIDYDLIPEIMVDAFSPIDLLFYGLAIFFGYTYSFRQITEQEIIDNAAE